MTAQELIRKLLDILSQDAQGGEQAQQQAELTPVQNPFPEDEHTSDVTGGVYVPPLQQKMELLKKMAGVDSVYDEPGAEPSAEQETVPAQDDPITVMKRNAGIPIMVSIASEDNDIVG